VLGIIRADDVTVDVRALAVDGRQLFGAARVRDPRAWPLLVDEPGVASAFMTAQEWTIAAGGDVMLDKAVYNQSIRRRQGVDYAWVGGTAVIDRRYCCGWGHKPLALGRRTGNAGAVGDLFRQADLAIVNLESPEPNRYRYHASGFTFTGDPELLVGLQDAGIDLAGLANNHLGNGGTRGVLDTIRHLDQLGISHAGAGTSQANARKAAWLQAGGLRVAVLAYCQIDPFTYWTAPGRPGSAAYSLPAIVRDIKAAKKAGADIVIVMPHWGIEYTDAVLRVQRTDARRMIAAGADLILGSHSHWVGPFEQIAPGRFAFYSLGDLVFDWTHDERTQEGVVADLTYVGNRLVQIDLHPTLIIAGQPNLLDPAGDGQAVLGPLRRTSQPSLRW
jgi:poly-gamma-glutamate capsule biosynthesis protein CapA/YwtB (metallophosphatase superfamily)